MYTLATAMVLVALTAPAADLVVTGIDGRAHMVDAASLQAPPAATVALGPARYAGPLLWDVLGRAKVIDQGNSRLLAGETVLVTGRDGYTAAIAAGELAPVFAGKKVILAITKDGSPLGEGRVRLVVEGDAKAGRSVKDVARITVRGP